MKYWHVVGEDGGLQVDPAKVEGVHRIMAHTTVGRGGTTTSGLCNYYYRSVIQGFGRDCQTLTPPAGVQFTFQFGKLAVCQEAFGELHNHIVHALVGHDFPD